MKKTKKDELEMQKQFEDGFEATMNNVEAHNLMALLKSGFIVPANDDVVQWINNL